MRDQEIVGLYEAYQSIYSNVNEEVEQLDELKLDTMLSAREERKKRIDADIEAGNDSKAKEGMDKQDRTKRLIRKRRNPDSVAGTPHFPSGSTAYRKEEVETWVNSLVEEGYDLSDYTWDDMYEMYMNLDEKAPQTIKLPATNPLLMPNAGRARLHKPKKVTEETNLFNYLLEYLVAEGYADTNKAAINIMSHMSEEWKQDIVEAMSSYDRNRKRAAQRAAERNAARDRGQTGNVPGVGYVSPRRERETYRDSAGVERHKTGARMPKKD